MNTKLISIMWSVSLIIIGIATLILAGANIIAIELPDIAVRVLGILDLICVPVLVFTSIKRLGQIKAK